MAKVEGQLSFLGAVEAELEDPSAKRAFAILEMANELGWTENPFASFVVRLTREDGLPFFAAWHFSFNPETGKRSWRFQGARAQNGQPLAFNDIKTYLNDPDVIHPDPPSGPEDDTDENVRTALGSLDPLGPTASLHGPPVKPVAKPAIPSLDWGAILS